MSQPNLILSTSIRKRDGRLQPFDSRKVDSFLRALSWGLDSTCVDISAIITNLTSRLPADTMDAEAFLVFLAEIVASFSSRHPDYSILAGRVYATYHHKRVPKHFSAWVLSQENASPPVFIDQVFATVRQHGDTLDAAIMHHRDFDFTYRALQIFERSYLLKTGRELIERLQFLFMRVSIGIHGDRVEDVLETYDLLSKRKISFASPILWNGGLARRHYSSCYIYAPLANVASDAIASFTSLSELWSSGGGIGIDAGDVPATRGSSSDAHPGLLPLLKVFDSIGAFWSRSSRHRASSATVYLPIWHHDVRRFVLSRTNRASIGYRFRHIFPALWIPSLFMSRMEADENWSLFDPAQVEGLSDLFGAGFDAAYIDYERRGFATTALSARGIWETISDAIRESGGPFLMYSDHINNKNNQQNLGMIKASNLCTEIVQYSSPFETAVCTLASLCLPQYLDSDGAFDYAELHRVTKLLVRCLDNLIDLANYPNADAAVSAYRTRSIAIGTQGLADVFAMKELAFLSLLARAMNCRIYETVYHAALESSNELASAKGAHDAWIGSPAQQGVLQIDMWDAEPSTRYDFNSLRQRIQQSGLRNSVLTAQMPTASTAQLFGNSEGIDPYVSNVVQFRVLSGNYNEISRPLICALQKRGLWTERMRSDILACRGSVQTISAVPDDLKAVFLTAFEIDQRGLVDMSADRGPFLDQSQSFTLFLAAPTSENIMDIQLHAWKSGLKTGAYYVRSKASTEPLPVGVPRLPPKGPPYSATTTSASVFPESQTCPCDA